ncbi:sodium/hydrogen exchanger 3-like isoform X2 [Apostichopus japonicus]|uniref:sodium/hydrogen exchanger 3-like isoform X2 n=1 Tax=Stichopus japonicus TaxID=307972 RepID=UPI003AB13140
MKSLTWTAMVMCALVVLLPGVASVTEDSADLVIEMYLNETEIPETLEHCGDHERMTEFKVARLQWHEVDIPLIIALWIIFATIVRLAFSFSSLEKYIPESCILICTGFVIGGIVLILSAVTSSKSGHPNDTVHSTRYAGVLQLESELFFLFLLPPIMLEAGYFMPVRAFTNNLATILLFAVIGTLFNAVTVGLSLFAVSEFGWLGSDGNETIRVSFLECFTFSSLISAVDPVAVLAVFEEIHVNQVLYILVFGESLLNDAVTVVLYRMFETFNEIGEDNLQTKDIIFGILSFFVVSLGGVFVGALFGFLTAVITRFAHHVRVIEPVFVFVMSYLAYLTAELLSLSSIMSIVTCAMVMKPYVERNISQKSHTTIKYSMKMLSSLSETIIFIFLGVSTLTETDNHQWNTSFVFFTLIFTFVYRFLGVIWQCFLANRYRLLKIKSKEKFIMAYGGIRGAIAFSLVALLCETIVLSKKIFFTTTIVIVMFTMFVQGMTIKPLVNKLHVKKEEKHKPSMNEEIFARVNDHILAGMELILGHEGRNSVREQWRHFDNKFLKKLLIRDYKAVSDPKILDVYQKLTEKDATDYIKEHGTFHLSASVSNFLRTEIGGSGMLHNSSSASLSGQVPMGEGVPCLDMHATDTQAVPGRVQKESVNHHTEFLTNNMYRARSDVYPISKVSVASNPESLMYRSMKIHIDHKMKHKKRGHGYHKKSKTSLHSKKGSDAQLLVPPRVMIHPADNDSKHNDYSAEENQFSASNQIADEDVGITFSAADAVDEIDVPGKEDNRELEEHKLSIQESSVPWRLSKMDVTPSERASEDPHDEFGNKIPASQDEGQREGIQEDEKPPQLDGIQEQRDLEVKITLGGDSDEEDNEEVTDTQL